MATDIAFAIGILSLLGKRVPLSLKIFLTALAVIDDLGAILVIAIFYTATLQWMYLLLALAVYLLLFGIRKMKVDNLIPYLMGGIVMWYFMLHSGVHPTITGVLLAFAIPDNPSYRLQHYLHKPVAFIILPVFAAANTLIIIGNDVVKSFSANEAIGILTGLIFGKPLGIALFAFIGVKMGLAALPDDLKWKHIIPVGILGGIGFTMSIFITLLAFDNEEFIHNAKISILASSAIAGLLGYVLLNRTLKRTVSVNRK
jgi:NhaA family Na+:H+ antiporter